MEVDIYEGHGPTHLDDIRSRLTPGSEKRVVVGHALWDLHDANLSPFDRDDVCALADHVRISVHGRSGRNLDGVISSPADFGLRHMLEMLVAGTELKFGVFHDVDEAMRWLAN